MNLTDTIESAETTFRQILEDFFISVFNEKQLPSHDLTHHRRVWNYSKKLLLLFNEKYPGQVINLPEKLIISSYLHDIGMTVEKGPRHGTHSMLFCQEFLRRNNFRLEDYTDVLETIENHDNKNYNPAGTANTLLKLLSVADDLDAFGYTGIYRYSEIYSLRGISVSELSERVRQNALKRFENFASEFMFSADFVDIHRKRFEILNGFFENLDKEIKLNSDNNNYSDIINLLGEITKGGLKIDDLTDNIPNYSRNLFVNDFFKKLSQELATT
jgi:HD superfamily phosphodiesterase